MCDLVEHADLRQGEWALQQSSIEQTHSAGVKAVEAADAVGGGKL
jgi:hypothetical protein